MHLSLIGAISKRKSYFGYGNGTIWMDFADHSCTGSEMKLLDCPIKYRTGAYSTTGYLSFCDYQGLTGVICPSEREY